MKDWLAKALKRSGLSQAELARTLTKKLGRSIDRAAVNKMLSGVRRVSADEMLEIARLSGLEPPARNDTPRPIGQLPHHGDVMAGSWLETDLEPGEPKLVPASVDTRFPLEFQYVLDVRGDSMNRSFPDGCQVTCVEFIASGVQLRSGLFVHVERQDGHRIESTIKRVGAKKRNLWVLEPDSTNPKWKPFVADGDGETTVIVKGIVVGRYIPIPL